MEGAGRGAAHMNAPMHAPMQTCTHASASMQLHPCKRAPMQLHPCNCTDACLEHEMLPPPLLFYPALADRLLKAN